MSTSQLGQKEQDRQPGVYVTVQVEKKGGSTGVYVGHSVGSKNMKVNLVFTSQLRQKGQEGQPGLCHTSGRPT